MDVFAQSRTSGVNGNYYALVIVNDYSRYIWTIFHSHKRKHLLHFKN